MKIIAFAGSPSKNSVNKKLATYAASLFKNATVEVLDLNDYEMPLFTVDKELTIGKHPHAKEFLEKMASANVIVLSLAENNKNYSAAFKNLFDWCSRIDVKVFQDKPMLLLSTSPGRGGGSWVLEIAEKAFPHYGAFIKGTFSLPSFNENFDAKKGIISNIEKQVELEKIVADNFL